MRLIIGRLPKKWRKLTSRAWGASNVGVNKKTRIVIADDHAVLRESLAALLESQNDFYVQGKAKDGEEAVALVNKYHPDVLVLDLFMPDSDGFEVLAMLERNGYQVSSVALAG